MERGDAGPGSLTLREIIDQHGAALVADFQRFYGLRLSRAVCGDYAPRVLLALVENLPESSAFAVSARGGREFAGWDTSAYLLAGLIDSVNMTTWAVANQNARRKSARPKPIERPGQRRTRSAREVISQHPRALPIPSHRLPREGS